MTITHRAWSTSARYLYEGFGSTAPAAIKSLQGCLDEHAGQLGYEEGWQAEMMAIAVTQPVECSSSRSGRDHGDDAAAWTELIKGDPALPVTHRAVVETSQGDEYLIVEGYGDTEDGAVHAVTAGLRVVHPDGMSGSLSIEDLLDDVTIYEIEDGGGYRGGLETDYGARIF